MTIKFFETPPPPPSPTSSPTSISIMASSTKTPSIVKSFTKEKWIVTIAILLAVFFQSLTFYSIACNLVLYLQTELHFTNVSSITITMVFSGFVYLAPLVGGYLAENIFGRFNTIVASAMVFLLGTILTLVSTLDNSSNLTKRISFFFIGLIFTGLGSGIFRTNIIPFGAQQLENLETHAVTSFFNWYYWFTSLAAAFAYLFVAYIQQKISFLFGYLVPIICILLVIIIFLSPKKIYRYEETNGKGLRSFFQVFLSAFRHYKRNRKLKLPNFFDYACFTNGGDISDDQVKESQQVVRIIPILATNIVFWTVFVQMDSLFFLQGEHLNLNLTQLSSNKENFIIPVASIILFDNFVILLITPLIDKVIIPLFLLRYFNYTPSHFQKIGLGMLLGTAAMCVAGVVEIVRKNDIKTGNGWPQKINGHTFVSSKITVFAQIPQFLLIGISEILTIVTSLQFAIQEAPKGMRNMITSVCLITSGLGSFLGSALVFLVKAASGGCWMPENLNEGKMENFCFLLGGLMFLDFLIFLLVVYNFNQGKYQVPSLNNEIALKERLSFYRDVDQFFTIPDNDILFD